MNPIQISLAVDNGNAMGKYAVSLNGKTLTPFKVPSVYKVVETVTAEAVKIGRQQYIYGNAALRGTRGIQGSTLEDRDKVKNLPICIASTLAHLAPEGGNIELSLVVSNPFASPTGENTKLSKEVAKTLKAIEAFTAGGKEYTIALKTVGVVPEGQKILETQEQFNGSIDLGQGTLLAAYRSIDGIQNLSLNDSQLGGCNLVLNAMLQNADFLAELRSKGFTAPPSAQKIATLLSNQTFEVKGLDFRKYLKPQLKTVKTRIENAARSIASHLALADPDVTVTPKIVLLGGGAALLRAVIAEEQLCKWCQKHNLTLIEQPDFQSALIALHLLQTSPEQFLSVAAPGQVTAAAVKRQVTEVLSNSTGSDQLSNIPALSTNEA